MKLKSEVCVCRCVEVAFNLDQFWGALELVTCGDMEQDKIEEDTVE